MYYTFEGKGHFTRTVASSPEMAMLLEHLPFVYGYTNEGNTCPTVSFDLTEIHEGENNTKGKELVLNYELVGNEFAQPQYIQLLIKWDESRHVYVSKTFAMKAHLKAEGWLLGTPFDKEDSFHPFDLENEGWDGPEVLIGPCFESQTVFLCFPPDVFQKLYGLQMERRDQEGIIISKDLRVLMDLKYRDTVLEDTKVNLPAHLAQKVAGAEVPESDTPF